MVKNFKDFDLLILLIGFLYGNLFAINFSYQNWNLTFIFFIVVFLELANKLVYFNFKNKKFTYSLNTEKLIKKQIKKNKNSLLVILNTLKRGFIFGVFLEAFKVGSQIKLDD